MYINVTITFYTFLHTNKSNAICFSFPVAYAASNKDHKICYIRVVIFLSMQPCNIYSKLLQNGFKTWKKCPVTQSEKQIFNWGQNIFCFQLLVPVSSITASVNHSDFFPVFQTPNVKYDVINKMWLIDSVCHYAALLKAVGVLKHLDCWQDWKTFTYTSFFQIPLRFGVHGKRNKAICEVRRQVSGYGGASS